MVCIAKEGQRGRLCNNRSDRGCAVGGGGEGEGGEDDHREEGGERCLTRRASMRKLQRVSVAEFVLRDDGGGDGGRSKEEVTTYPEMQKKISTPTKPPGSHSVHVIKDDGDHGDSTKAVNVGTVAKRLDTVVEGLFVLPLAPRRSPQTNRPHSQRTTSSTVGSSSAGSASSSSTSSSSALSAARRCQMASSRCRLGVGVEDLVVDWHCPPFAHVVAVTGTSSLCLLLCDNHASFSVCLKCPVRRHRQARWPIFRRLRPPAPTSASSTSSTATRRAPTQNQFI